MYFSFSTHKQCILGRLNKTAVLCFPWKTYTLAGFEPWSSVLEVDAMSTASPPGQMAGVWIYLCKYVLELWASKTY
jgi:hypothetical protein